MMKLLLTIACLTTLGSFTQSQKQHNAANPNTIFYLTDNYCCATQIKTFTKVKLISDFSPESVINLSI